MCINFNGYHSGGSSFLIVNDYWLLQNYLYTTDISSALKKKKKRVPVYSFAPRNRFGFANRVGPGSGA